MNSTNFLRNLFVSSGSFMGMTVRQVLDEANIVLGGGSSAFSASQLQSEISFININYFQNNNFGHLACPCPEILGKYNLNMTTEEEPAATTPEQIYVNSPLATGLTLFTGYPNPFVEKITLEFSLDHHSPAKLQVFSMTGKLIETIFDGNVKPLEKNTVLYTGGEKLSAGLYLFKLTTDNGVFSQKILMSDK
jgi:hypothetical protein